MLQYLNRSRSSSDPVTPESIPKTQRELDSSMEDDIPPTKADRKSSPVSEASWLGAPKWAQILYEEIFEIKSQVKSVTDMKEEILYEIRVETNKFKEELIAQVEEWKQASSFLSTVFDDVKAKQVNTDTTLAAVNQENVNLKKEVNGLKIQLDNLEQYSRRNCLVINGIPEVPSAYQTTTKRRAESEDQVNHQEVHSEMPPNIPPPENSTDQILLELFRTKLNIDVNIKDIDRSHRVGRKQLTSRDKLRPIICKFTNYNTRQAVFKARRNLKGSHTTIVENLTARKIAILMKARERFGARQAWSMEGRIYAIVKRVKTKFESVEAVEKA